jgi:glutamate-1-semialdehyde 2,1-aminomutase
MDSKLQALLDAAAAEVTKKLPNSVERYQEACAVIPHGANRSRFWWPIPIYVESGEGSHLYDVDGHRLLDLVTGFGPLILGHRHPAVLAAIEDQLSRGLLFGAAGTDELELGQMIVSKVPGAESIVFLNSGTEATLCAVRLARAFTGKQKVAKFEGAWHGWHDILFHSFWSSGGEWDHPITIPDTLGVAAGAAEELTILPYNSPAAFDRIREQGGDLACVIVEGILGGGGAVPADPQFMRDLRRVCDETGVLLIMDEVITAFRLGETGAAGRFGIQGDLTAMGKIIGGGLPVGAVCGRSELLAKITPDASGKAVVVTGTFAANPMTMAAGKAQLNVLFSDPGLYLKLDRLGDKMRSGIAAAAEESGVNAHVTGLSSMWGVHFTPQEPHNIREVRSDYEALGRLLSAYLLLDGVLVSSPMHLGFVSTAHTDQDVDVAIEAHAKAFQRMKREGAFESYGLSAREAANV